jgi:hypothetical protein
MSAAEKIAPITESLTWAQICERHPSEWVCLVEVEYDTDGSIGAARLIGHHRSAKEALKHVDAWGDDLAVVCAHTAGRKLRIPRIEVTDEVRECVRARR